MVFAHDHQVHMHDPLPKLQLARGGDKSVMGMFLEGPYTPDELVKLIAWRQFYDITFVSDVVSVSGDCLLQHIWTGDTLRRRRDNPSSPRRPPRRSLDLALWQRSLSPLICSRLNLHLRSPLGDWHSQPPDSWLFLYSPSTDRVYQRSGALWIHYRCSGLRVNRRLHHGTFCRISDWCCDLPSDSCRADVRRNRISVILLSIGRHREAVLAPSPTELTTAITIVNQKHSWATETLLHMDNGVSVAQAIRDGTCLAVSDGSFKASRSTSAFLLEGSAGGSGRIYGTNRVPGQRMDQDSYREELGGILGVLHTAHCIAMIHGVRSGCIRLGLDGEEAMKQAAIVGPIHPKMRSFDLLAEIRSSLAPRLHCRLFLDRRASTRATWERRLLRLFKQLM
jgi:hypothetical protein